MLKNKSLWTIFSVLMVLMLVLTACSSGVATPSEEPVVEKEQATPAEASTENIGTFAFFANLPNLDPRTNYDYEVGVLANIYETLTFYDPQENGDLVVPKLATSWESNEDFTEWTFHLREGVKFHDGADFNAEAVKITVDKIMTSDYPTSVFYLAVDEVEVIDDLTVRFKLTYGAPLDLILSSAFGAWMISPNDINKEAEWFNAGNGAGTGPYQYKSYEPNQQLVMEKFDDYWGGWEDGQFTTVVYKIVEDSTVREQMIRSGDADVTWQLSYDSYATLEGSGAKVYVEPAFQNVIIDMNTAKPPLDDVKVRQALAYSFPYDKVVDNLFGGYATQSIGIVPAGMWGHDPNLPQYNYDLDKAKELLAKAGYPDGGFELTEYVNSSASEEIQMAELWQAELAQLGIKLNIRPMEFETWLESCFCGPDAAEYNLWDSLWFPSYVTPFDFLYNNFVSESIYDCSFYFNEEFENLVFEGDALSTDREAATELFKRAQEILIEDSPAIFAIDLPMVIAVRDDIQGFYTNPGYNGVVFWYNLRR